MNLPPTNPVNPLSTEPDRWVPVSEGFPTKSRFYAVYAKIHKTHSRNVTLVRWNTSKPFDQQTAIAWKRAISWFSFCIPIPSSEQS